MLRFFRYDHLPESLQNVSRQFASLAFFITSNIEESEERNVALRKLLESKDCAVRAKLEEL